MIEIIISCCFSAVSSPLALHSSLLRTLTSTTLRYADGEMDQRKCCQIITLVVHKHTDALVLTQANKHAQIRD